MTELRERVFYNDAAFDVVDDVLLLTARRSSQPELCDNTSG